MSTMFSQAIWLLAALSVFFVQGVEAYCARCAKIEAERSQEQAANPKPLQYYDDQIGLHKKDGQQAAHQPQAAAESKHE